MAGKLSYSQQPRSPAISRHFWRLLVAVGAGVMLCAPQAAARGEAPAWMHDLVGAAIPPHAERTDAVQLYSEKNVTVFSPDKIQIQVREAYKILRPDGRTRGTVAVYFNPQRKIKSMSGWCIPATGKDYEVKEQDALDVSPNGQWAELVSDVKFRLLRIPAPDPGNIVGYEYEVEEQPFYLQDIWDFQEIDPVRESHYSLQLPPDWEYKVSWINSSATEPTAAGGNTWHWTIHDVKEIQSEARMPPLSGVEGMMVVSFFPPGGSAAKRFANWSEMGSWYWELTNGRRDASPEIKQKVVALTASLPSTLEKMSAVAQFLQHDIRYVAIELGIGGFQPHSANDVFTHQFGDCKDKVTLMSSMLHEIGVESDYVLINATRGSVTRDMPVHNGFNHAILAIKLPDDLANSSLVAVVRHPVLGRVLFFDPTDEMTPLGQIRGDLQGNYGLLITPNHSELLELPVQPPGMNGIQRVGKLTLDGSGLLKGEVKEMRVGDRAQEQRWALRVAKTDADRIKPIESLLADSLGNFRITKASLSNVQQTGRPLGFNYWFEAEGYAKPSGKVLLLRPRVLGTKASDLLETNELRRFPIEFEGSSRDSDMFEITLPPGYQVDDLPPPVDADFDFGSYHSKTEVNGNVIRYTRTFEMREPSVPVSGVDQLRKFYRIIAGDERNAVLLKLVPN